MGQKTHPIGFRLGVIKDWQSRWFASKAEEYSNLIKEDIEVRKTILDRYPDAGISRVEIERSNDVVITVHTARPGIVIGRGGQRVEELRKELEAGTSKRARLNVQEIRQPELDAYLVARNVAEQLERRVAFRRAIRQTVIRTMQAGALGIKILISGRLGGADIARQEKAMEGRVPLHTLRADIDYNIAEAATEFGRIGIKVWIYKGDIVPEPAEIQADPAAQPDMPPIQVNVSGNAPAPQPAQAAPQPAQAAPQVVPAAPPAPPAAPVQPAAPVAAPPPPAQPTPAPVAPPQAAPVAAPPAQPVAPAQSTPAPATPPVQPTTPVATPPAAPVVTSPPVQPAPPAEPAITPPAQPAPAQTEPAATPPTQSAPAQPDPAPAQPAPEPTPETAPTSAPEPTPEPTGENNNAPAQES